MGLIFAPGTLSIYFGSARSTDGYTKYYCSRGGSSRGHLCARRMHGARGRVCMTTVHFYGIACIVAVARYSPGKVSGLGGRKNTVFILDKRPGRVCLPSLVHPNVFTGVDLN